MNHVQIAADIVRSETSDDPEHLAGAAMCLVQARVRAWRERARFAVGAGFTTWPDDILASGAGFCGSTVAAWRAILGELGIRSRQINLSWGAVGHVCGEAWWGGWHFFDIQNGTLWLRDGVVLGFGTIRGNPDEATYRVSNEGWIRYTAHEAWFADDPFAYLRVPDLTVVYVK